METQVIEYKEFWRDEYLEWICGYANAFGGKLYIGINDKGEVIELKNLRKLLEDIPNKIKSSLGIVCDVNLKYDKELPYIEIITPQVNQVITYHGKVHYRSGATKQILEGTALTSFMMKKMGKSWDSMEIEDLALEEFDNDSFRIFKERGLENKRLSPNDITLTKEELMNKLNLIRNGKITYAGMLMFYQKPEKFVPGSFVKIGYFDERNELVYHDEIKGSLVKQAEAVMNSIIHKLYQTGNPIQIKIFPDKLIIFNECIFPDEWTVNDLFNIHNSRAINRLIADSFYMMGLVETWGQGIEKMCNGLKNASQQLPIITPLKSLFTIEFKAKFIDRINDRINDRVNDRINGTNLSDLIYTVICENPGIKVSHILKMIQCQIPEVTKSKIENAIKRNLKNKVKFMGAPKSGGYYLKDRE